MYIGQGKGACYILTTNFFRVFSRLKDDVFLWGEEVLLGYQLRTVDGKILYVPSLVVYHTQKQSITQIPSKERYKRKKESFATYSKYL